MLLQLPEEFNDPAYEEQKAKIEELKNQVVYVVQTAVVGSWIAAKVVIQTIV